MPLELLPPGENLGLHRGDVVICIPVFGGYELFAQCLASVLAHTDPSVPILICDDASPDPQLERWAQQTMREGAWPHHVHYQRAVTNAGFVENVNAGFAASDPADVVVLNSDCIVTEGWLDGLRDAVDGDVRIATATALTNAGTIVSVPDRNRPAAQLAADLTVAGVAAAIRGESLRLHPDLPTCVGHCVYIRRAALELVGPLDPTFSPGYEEEVDFSQRCLIHGLRHVLADDVFVYHRHAGSFGSGAEVQRWRSDHEQIVHSRYPYYYQWVEEVRAEDHSPLARSITAGRAAMQGPSVTIDGRCLTSFATGTSRVTLELVAALDAHTGLRLRLLVPEDLDAYARETLADRPAVELLPVPAAQDGAVARSDVVHRPYQVAHPEDLELLRRLGTRLITTQLDTIALRNPAYFGSYAEWRGYRTLTAATLATSDQVIFISAHAAGDAGSLELVDPARVNVITPSTESMLPTPPIGPAPAAATALEDRQFLFCVGTDFLHKNRLFALRLFDALVAEHDFDGLLVLAGVKVATGSSAGEEAAFLASRPQLAARVLDLGAVDEAEKRWLLGEATAVVYPTSSEGFGLIPFEAAQVGVPCLFAHHTSLADRLPVELATLVPWSPAESARQAAPVLIPGPERERVIAGVRTAGAQLTAPDHAHAHADVYARALASSSPVAATLARDALRLQAELDAAREELAAAREELSEIYSDPLNRGLAGRYAILPAELRRPVLAIASRPSLRIAATSLYRVGHALRRRPGGSGPPPE